MRNIYLDTKELEEAIEIFHENLGEFFGDEKSEIIDSKDAFGRISKEAIFAK